MTEITANIDGQAIQQAIASAVLESSIGEHVKAAVEKHLKESYSSRSICESAVGSAVEKLIRDYAIQLVQDRQENFRAMIEAKITEQVLDAAMDRFITKCLDADRW